MENPLLHTEIQEFITAHIGESLPKLALKKNPFPDVNWIEIINQINSKTKAKDKLPTIFRTKNIIYPNAISIEQTSSEQTAHYKSEIVSGESLIDLSGGFGVDTYFFSKKITSVFHCELNAELSKLVAHNFKTLNATNVSFFTGDSAEIMTQLKQQFDWIYVDPSRRNETKGKVFMLRDCLPNVPELLPFYFTFSNAIMIKTAPILDITAGLSELQNVKAIHIVAVENEVKELLWVLEKNYDGQPRIKTINITKTDSCSVDFDYSKSSFPNWSLPKKYLYEPNSAIMKSGVTEQLCDQFNVSKLHSNSHLFTSENLVPFPGRRFQIEQEIRYDKQEMKLHLANKKVNVTTRNFPETVEQIRKKWKLSDGGSTFCFFTTNMNSDKIVLLCTKIK